MTSHETPHICRTLSDRSSRTLQALRSCVTPSIHFLYRNLTLPCIFCGTISALRRLLMKRTLLPFLATVVVAVTSIFAQNAQDVSHAPDGNSFTRIVSIFIPPTTDSPFTATVSTEWTRTTADGATVVVKNKRMVARDSQGHVFEERRRFVPADSTAPSLLFQMDYVDPVRHSRTVCLPASSMCDLRDFYEPVSTSTVPVGPIADGKHYLSREDLGKSETEGLETT